MNTIAAMLLLMTLDGRFVFVSPSHVVSMQTARDDSDPGKLTTAQVHCVVNLSDGKVVSVEEDCESVKRRLKELQQ